MRAIIIVAALTLTSCAKTEQQCAAKCRPNAYRWHERGVCDCAPN